MNYQLACENARKYAIKIAESVVVYYNDGGYDYTTYNDWLNSTLSTYKIRFDDKGHKHTDKEAY